jgi:hypothetical protein
MVLPSIAIEQPKLSLAAPSEFVSVAVWFMLAQPPLGSTKT